LGTKLQQGITHFRRVRAQQQGTNSLSNRTGEVQVHKSEWRTPTRVGLVKTCLLAFYYAFYYAILFFTTLFTTLREAPANDLYVFWHVPNRQYGEGEITPEMAELGLTCRDAFAVFSQNETLRLHAHAVELNERRPYHAGLISKRDLQDKTAYDRTPPSAARAPGTPSTCLVLAHKPTHTARLSGL